MKKLFVVLAILFIGILLAGCTSQKTEPVATTVPPTVQPTVVTTVPTVEPTKEVVVIVVNKTPNATPTATPTPIPTYTLTFTQDLTITPDPTIIYIKAGTMVVWKNTDPFKPHSIQASNIQTGAYFGGMSPVEIPYGQSLSVVFDKTGAYDYTTGPFQPQMSAKIVVQ